METSQSVTLRDFSRSPVIQELTPKMLKDESFDSDNCNFDEECMEEQQVEAPIPQSKRISMVAPEPAP